VSKKKWIEIAIAAVLLVLVGLLLAPKASQAMELNAAGPVQVMAGGSKTAAGLAFDAQSLSGTPTALMCWSGDGALFYIRRFMGPGTANLETISLKVPAGSSLIVPVRAFKVSGQDSFRVRVFVSAVGVTDSVYVMPMYR
jgi:hypothetical protein